VSEAGTTAEIKYTQKGLGALPWSRIFAKRWFKEATGIGIRKYIQFSDSSCFQMLSLMAITLKPNARATPNLQHIVRWIHSIGWGSQPLPVMYSFMLVKLITYPNGLNDVLDFNVTRQIYSAPWRYIWDLDSNKTRLQLKNSTSMWQTIQDTTYALLNFDWSRIFQYDRSAWLYEDVIDIATRLLAFTGLLLYGKRLIPDCVAGINC